MTLRLGHHELLERLGSGAMGVVWLARDVRDGSSVALKVLTADAGGRRFRREFKAALRLDHPHVVRVLEMGSGSIEGADRLWFTMEFVAGTTLRAIIDRDASGWPPERNSPEWLAARLSLLHQVALGLAHCHAHGVLHRDLKPTNVLVGDDGIARLADFGLARMDAGPSSLSGAGQLIGTVAYMSPEQARGGPLDARSDLHGLGALMHEVATGQPAFSAEDLPALLMQVLFRSPPDPREANADLDPAFAELAMRCLAKEPDARPPSAQAIASEIRAIARSRGIELGAVPAAPAAARLRPLTPRFVGRAREREALRSALERARAAPVIVTVSGRSGAGKTRLVDELRMDAALAGFQVVACSAQPAPRPLGVLREALTVAAAEARAAASTDADDVVRHDVRLLGSVLPDLIEQGADSAGGGAAPAPADRLRVAWAAEAVLARWFEQGPRMLVLDDLQWAEALSASVIERLVENLQGPALLVAIFQDDAAEPRPPADRLRSQLAGTTGGFAIELGPLDAADVGRVVESMLGRAPAADVVAQVRRATGGLPRHVEQLVRELALLGGACADGDGLALTLPATTSLADLCASDATRSHLAALGPTARRVVMAVMLAGRGVSVRTLGLALALDEDALLDEVEALVGAGILRDGPGPDAVSLAHEHVRQALSAASSTDEMSAMRGLLARALEGDDAAGRDQHRIAELDLASGAIAHALRTVPPSAEAFAAAGLHAAAIERYEALIALAVTAGETPPALARKRRAELLGQAGRTQDAMAAMRGMASDPSMVEVLPPRDALRLEAFYLMLLTRHAEAAEVLERALQAARAASHASGTVRALSVLGTVEDRRARRERSQALHDQAVSEARARGSELDLAMALTNLAVTALRHGRTAAATPAYEEAATLFDRAGDPLHAANCRAGLAAALLSREEPGACLPIAREALAAMRRAVDVRGLSRVLELMGLASIDLGDVEAAEAHLGEALAIRQRLNEPWAEGETMLHLASLAASRCQWSRAAGHLHVAGELFERAADSGRAALVRARQADLAWRSGGAGARDLAERALEAAGAADAPIARLEAQLALARVDADEGMAPRALERLREALALESSDGPGRFALEGELLACRARAGDLGGLAEDAARVAERASRRPPARRVLDLLAAGLAFRATGDERQAAQCAGDAERLRERLAGGLPEGDRERFDGQHAHARLLAATRGRDQEDVMSSIEHEELDQLRAFHALVMDSDPSEPDTLLAAFVAGALRQLDFARGLVFVAAPPGEPPGFSCRAARDASGADIPPAERRVPDQLLRLALERREPVLTLGVREDPSVTWEGSVADMSVEAFAAVPVVTRDGLRVVAYFDGPPPRRDVRDALRRLAPVFADLGALLDRSRRVKVRAERAEAILSSMGGGDGLIVGADPSIDALRRLIRTVAPTDASVLILGENGTGKELVARELHARSLRKDGPLLTRSCAELTETLLESEIFGHEKGAFTGATRDRGGLFEAASGGTLFLDEVGEMSPALQAKLLRVLETGEITRIGSTARRSVDVRAVAATHRDLAASVKDGTFRQDLYYRLKVIEIRVPALRERRGDIPVLAHHFLALSAARRERSLRGFTHEALRALARHDWPGNVRELRNVVERAVILAGDRDEIGLDLLPPETMAGAETGGADADAQPGVTGKDLRAAREAFEKACIERALEECSGNRTHAAKALGISLRSLQQKLGRHGVR